MKEINISGFGGNKEPKKWWVGVDEAPSTTCEAGWTDTWYAQKAHTKIGDAYVTFQCDNDNSIQFLNLEEHDKALEEEFRKAMLSLLEINIYEAKAVFPNCSSLEDVITNYSMSEIKEKIDKFKGFNVGDEVEWDILGVKGRGVVCKTDDENIHLYRYRKSFIKSAAIIPTIDIYRKDGPAYKSLKKTGQHYSDFELFDLINKGDLKDE